MADRLANGMPLCLQFLSCFVIGFPGLREFREPDLVEPRLAIGVHRANNGPGHRVEFLPVARDSAGVGIETSFVARYFLGDVTHVDNALGVEGRLIVENHNEVGTTSGLNGSRYSWLLVIAVHRLEVDLEAESLFGFGQQLFTEQLIRRRYEVVPPQPVDRGLLRVCGGPTRGQ